MADQDILNIAAARIFGNYELIEHILLSLPLRAILLARGINKAFDDVYLTSLNTRRALFLVRTADILYLHRARHEDNLAWKPSKGIWYVWTDSPHHSAEGSKLPDGTAKTPILNPFIDIWDYYHSLNFGSKPQGKKILISRLYTNNRRRFGSLDILATSGVRELGSRGDMAFTHPPTERPLKLSYSSPRSRKAVIGTYRAVVEYAIYLIGEGVRGITPFPEATSFMRFAVTIDTITGFEMLEMLQMDEQELLKQGLVVMRNKRED